MLTVNKHGCLNPRISKNSPFTEVEVENLALRDGEEECRMGIQNL